MTQTTSWRLDDHICYLKTPSLEELTMDGLSFLTFDLRVLLKALPLLHSLRLTQCAVSSETLDMLSETVKGQPLCPKLKVLDRSPLVCHCCGLDEYTPFDEHALLKMIRLRHAARTVADRGIEERVYVGYHSVGTGTLMELRQIVSECRMHHTGEELLPFK